MDLGTFSVSLAVQDLAASRKFYETPGFEAVGGDDAKGWLILGNGSAKIGLFMGMFEENILTFNPTDVRDIQKRLKDKGLSMVREAETGSGAAHAVLTDPDGNTILLDQR